MTAANPWRVWLELARVSNLPTVWTNVLAGWLLAGGRWEPLTLTWLLIGGSLLYTGGMFLNDAADARWDREHRSERPIATGRVGEKAVWIASWVFLLGGWLLAVLPGGANWIITLALVAAIVVYDLYHKPWKGSVIIMGACRVLLYLTAGSAVTGGLDWGAQRELVVKAIALGGYVVGLSLVARSEATQDKRELWSGFAGYCALRLPFITLFPDARVHWRLWAGALIVFSLGFFFKSIEIRDVKQYGDRKPGMVSWASLASILVLIVAVYYFAVPSRTSGYGFDFIIILSCASILWAVIVSATKRMHAPPPSNIGKAVGLLLAAIPAVDALAIAPHAPWLAAAFVVSVPLLRLWQRKISAT